MAASPVKQCQQCKAVKMQADPQERQEPQAIVLPGFASGSGGGSGVLLAQRRVLELRAQVSILLLQQLRVHRQQAVRTDVMEGDLSIASHLSTTQLQNISKM